MKKIVAINFGGTIIQSGKPARPKYSLESIVGRYPELNNIADIMIYDEFTESKYDSNDITKKEWGHLAQVIYREYMSTVVDGIVITHGTDTMEEATAYISFMLQNCGKPLIFTGSQILPDDENSDAGRNLYNSITAATTDLDGIYLMFDDKLIRGTRVMKNNSKEIDAFVSVNCDYAGRINCNELEINYDVAIIKKDDNCEPELKTLNGSNVGVVGIDSSTKIGDILYCASSKNGVILRGTGVGNIPARLFDVIEYTAQEKPIVMVSKCPQGGVIDGRYVAGDLKKIGVISGGDMTAHCAKAKLEWVLSEADSPDQVRHMMNRDYCGEMCA